MHPEYLTNIAIFIKSSTPFLSRRFMFIPHDCLPTIFQVAAGNKIRLNFEVFDLHSSAQCYDTFLGVTEGTTTLLVDKCGTDKLSDVTSKGNTIKVLYSSMSSAVGSKYKINYETGTIPYH